MQFLAVTRRRTEQFSEADFAAVLDEEARHAITLYRDGVFRALASRGDVPGAVITIEAPDRAGARAAMESLPLARRGMMDVEIIELMPYRGFVASL